MKFEDFSVEDAETTIIKHSLELESNHVEIAGDLSIASDFVSVTHFDIILLDIMLPDGDGRDFLRSIRAKNNNVPVIVMTARSEISDRVDLLDIGADDYIIKPFEFVELEARCRAVLRRHRGQDQQSLNFGNVVVYPSTVNEFDDGKLIRNREP